MADKDENIYVEFDYDNIILVDPNKVISSDGKVSERLVKHEELVMYANLEAYLLPRTRLNVSNAGNLSAQKISVGRVNFMKPANKSYLTNQYTDEFVGGNVDNTVSKEESKIVDDKGEKIYDTELLLINQISIENQYSQTMVTIELEDVRGRALFEKGEDSPYAAFFNYPPPAFYLTIKGYYGKAAQHQLALQKFNARFNTATGNFSITVTFITYKYNILSRIFVDYLFSLPFMYVRDYTISPNSDVNAQSSSNTTGNSNKGDVINRQSSYGRQKLHEVYVEYKNKNLIDINFPELTLQEFITRIDTLETNLTNLFKQADLKPITDAENFETDLAEYERQIFLYQSSSWFQKYMDTKNFLVDTQGREIYTFKKSIIEGNGNSQRQKADDELKSKIAENNQKLEKNESFKVQTTGIKYSTIRLENVTNNDIDWKKSYLQRTNKNSDDSQNKDDYAKFTADAQEILARAAVVENIGEKPKYYWYFFEGNNSFMNQTKNLRSELKIKSDQEQKKLSDILSSKIRDKEGGLGFDPLLKNFIAVVLANTEAFVRLLCDVQDKAWLQKDDIVRRSAIFDANKSVKGVDEKDSVEKSDSNLIPVYPWPQYFVEENTSKKDPYVLAYPGDSRYIANTKGYLYDKWPEVEFVEEFLRGRSLYGKAKTSMSTLSNESQVSDRVSLLALDFPVSNRIYANRQKVKFLFEIWERVYLYSNYSRFMRPDSKKEISDLVAESEFTNIVNAVDIDSPELLRMLRELSFNSNNFESTLKNISLGSWQKYIRDIFNTEYIQEEIANSFTIDETTALNPGFNYVLPTLTNLDSLKNYLKNKKSNEFNFVDTYPFNGFQSWYNQNMASASLTDYGNMNDTSQVLTVNDKTYMISNFGQTTTINENRPVTSFNYNNVQNPNVTTVEIENFYRQRFSDLNSKLIPTEGNLFYENYEGNLTEYQTTSILNTPYFVNSILEGVENLKSGSTIPFVSSAYLFINSLPLATLKEKYKNFDNTTKDTDYIFASLNKFGGVHKLPYSWILKYGSIWYRYKTWIRTGKDILSNVWNNFDRVQNFDPISNDPNKSYTLTIDGSATTINLQNVYNIGPTKVSTLDVGFYPKVINDFNYLFNGNDLFNNYSDTEIQSFIDTNSGFSMVYGISYENNISNNPNNYILIRGFSCLLNLTSNEQVVLPSFGTNAFQVNSECFDDLGKQILPIISNDSIYNGSVRAFWALPQYGYFDNSKVNIPQPDEYMKSILSDSKNQETFSVRGRGYSKIEELFAVFGRKELDVMEAEFLKFSGSKFMYNVDNKTIQDISKQQPSTLPKDQNAIFRNFHNLLISLLKVPKTTSTEFEQLNTEVQNNQFNNITSYLKSFLEYDVLVKFANPSDFDRRLFDSFSNRPPVEPFQFKSYLIGSLPEETNNSLTLVDYLNANPQAWQSLYLNVGFSTIDGLSYSSTGSSITDFFIDSNIEFTPENVQVLAPLIKIYATKKVKDSTYNFIKFKSDVTKYLDDNREFSDLVFNSLFNQLRRKLPVVSDKAADDKPTAVEGNQVKLDMYEAFKALNDSWIAGYDYTLTTFMEDVLLLDRANRNISNFVYFDPFKIKNNLSQQGMDKTYSVQTLLMKTIREHNFNVDVMSSYVNYYYTGEIGNNKPNPASVLEFGNTLFGTHMNVDTSYSSPKILCTALAKPSEHLDNSKNPNYRYNNDIFYIERRNNPLREDLKDKDDYDKSNKVVAFNVDIGTRNQNIFYNFDVSQDGVKETYGSLMNTDYQINQFNGKKVATQNYSYWDFYKTRSYTCTVRCLGNALLQPSMYFNLRYVPMFYGPYMITTVKHSITPGLFETTFTGIRQSVFNYEVINNMEEYLQILTRQILNDIQNKTKQNLGTTGDISKRKLTESLDKTELGDEQESSSCEKLLPDQYKQFIPTQESSITATSVNTVIKNLKKYFPNNDEIGNKLRAISFVTMYIASFDGQKFISFNNNYCGLLTGLQDTKTNKGKFKQFGGNLSNFIEKKFTCRNLKSQGLSVPTAVFDNEENMYKFLQAKWTPIVSKEIDVQELYYRFWNKSLSRLDYENFKKQDSNYSLFIIEIVEALNYADTAGLYN